MFVEREGEGEGDRSRTGNDLNDCNFFNVGITQLKVSVESLLEQSISLSDEEPSY